ncbi:MAG TPA: chloride channel protein [Terriglobales bacterium]|nr:chloride channel protein [Terriglobales bacterium]
MSSNQTPTSPGGEAVAAPATPRSHWHARLRLIREEPFFLLMAIFIGILSGLAVVCFRIAYLSVRTWLLSTSLSPSPSHLLLVPSLTGIVIALLVIYVFPRVRGSGVNQTKAALYIYNGHIPFRTVIGKFICSALAIGSGQSLGPEDPSLQIGAGIASLLGERLQLSRERLRLIAPVGAAAGLAAAFNAPISAVLFVIEEVIGRWSAGVLGAVVLAAVSSVVVERFFLGSEPLFRVPPVGVVNPGELLAYAVLGVVGGIASVIFVKMITYFRMRLKSAPAWTQYLQPGVAGLLIGFIGYLGFPQVMGAGYAYMDQAMHSQYTWQILGILAGLKILATTISFVSGTPGGMFAPTLFIGAMLGGSVGALEHQLLPHFSGPIGAYCLVGMGTLFAGFIRAPMTSVFMVLEVSGDYTIIVPVIISNAIAYIISRAAQPTPIFDLLSRQSGMDLPSMEEQREQSPLHVEDAMRPPRTPLLTGEEPVGVALRELEQSTEPLLLFRLPDGVWRGLTRKKLAEVAEQGDADLPLKMAAAQDSVAPLLHPDHPLDTAMRHIYDWPLLPVVHRADPAQLQGVVSLPDILNAYRRVVGAPGS